MAKEEELPNEEIIEKINSLQEKTEGEDQGEKVKQKIENLKSRLVEKNIGLVKSVASDYLHSGVDFEDLTQAGYLGLLNASQNFDLSRGTKFSTYATHLIKGEIRHFIRDNQQVVHVPQWIKNLNKKVRQTQQEIYNETGELPTISELSEALNIEEDGIKEVLKARDSMTYVSIDKERREKDPRPEYIDYEAIKSKHEEKFPIEYKVRIARAIDKLSSVQKKVLEGLFYQGDTEEEVGDRIGTSQRQVSRIKYRVLEELKEELGDDMSKNEPDEE